MQSARHVGDHLTWRLLLSLEKLLTHETYDFGQRFHLQPQANQENTLELQVNFSFNVCVTRSYKGFRSFSNMYA